MQIKHRTFGCIGNLIKYEAQTLLLCSWCCFVASINEDMHKNCMRRTWWEVRGQWADKQGGQTDKLVKECCLLVPL